MAAQRSHQLVREFYVGLMSGTSLDGVDAALIDFSANPWRVVSTHYQTYPEQVRAEALALNAPVTGELERAAQLSVALADAYADAVASLLAQAKVAAASVQAIGCHGQTVRHRPELGYTIQLGNAARLAELSGIRVVADFRSRDIAAGGQGAPLVPAFHRAVFASSGVHRVVVNIGGIANLTDLPASGGTTIGFDTGPGNALLDWWANTELNQKMDAGGTFAARGEVDAALLVTLLNEPYFSAKPPKSTGRDLFNPAWLKKGLENVPKNVPNNALAGRSPSAANLQATLAELTALSIAQAIEAFCSGATEVYLCGGGVHNTDLVRRIGLRLAPRPVLSTLALGVDPDWVEAFAFAWLARCAITGQAGNLPEVTGAAGPRILGAVYPA